MSAGDDKPTGFTTLADAVAAIISYERAKRRTISETAWPTMARASAVTPRPDPIPISPNSGRRILMFHMLATR